MKYSVSVLAMCGQTSDTVFSRHKLVASAPSIPFIPPIKINNSAGKRWRMMLSGLLWGRFVSR